MSIFVTSLVWKFSKAEGSTLLTALAIADFADDDGRAFPSVSTLATKARISERTAQYALAELAQLGELNIEHGTGPHGCNTYFVRVDKLRQGGADSAGGANSAGVQRVAPGGCSELHPNRQENRHKKKKPPTPKVELIGAAGQHQFVVPDTLLDQWREAYPGVSLDVEIAKAAAWVNANLQRAPKSNFSRFLNGWMNRAHSDARRPALKVVAGTDSRQAMREQFNRELWGDPQPQGESNVIDVVATEVSGG